MELSKQALERIASAEAIKQISPMLAFPGCVVRITLVPGELSHEILVEYTDLGTKASEHVHAKAVTLPSQIRAGIDAGKFRLAYRDGTAKWNVFFERTVGEAAGMRHPTVELDWR